jgi:ribosomal protein S27AE
MDITLATATIECDRCHKFVHWATHDKLYGGWMCGDCKYKEDVLQEGVSHNPKEV